MRNYPAIKFTILFIAGIFLHQFAQIDYYIFYICVGVFLLLILLSVKIKIEKIQFITLIFTFLSVILLGNYLAEVNKNEVQLLPTNLYKQKNMEVYGTIKKLELPRSYETRFVLDVDSFKVSRYNC